MSKKRQIASVGGVLRGLGARAGAGFAAFLSTGSLLLLLLGGCDGGKLAGGKVDGPASYEAVCSRCHGIDGVPSKGMQVRSGVKPLTSERVQAMSDADILKQIRQGSKNRMMPSFQGTMSDEQLVALVAHIRTLGKPASANREAAVESAPGVAKDAPQAPQNAPLESKTSVQPKTPLQE